MNEARRRVVLSTVGDVRDGDVFYLVSDPSRVWRFRTVIWDYPYQRLGIDTWFRLEEVGDGDPKQRVIIIHNTKESST